MSRDLDKLLKDYEEIFARPTPVRYNVLHFSDEHRRMDALLRRHYDILHPMVKDIFTSFSLEFSLLLEEVETMQNKMEEMEGETSLKQEQLDEELDSRFERFKNENQEYLKIIKDNERELEKLQQIIEEKEQSVQEKDALVVTQRRQLDVYIDEKSQSDTEQEHQQKQVVESIENVSAFTDQLVDLEQKMREMEEQRASLQKTNRDLSQKLQLNEDQYINEISEISELYQSVKSETNELNRKLDKIEQKKDVSVEKLTQIRDQYEQLESKSIRLYEENKELKSHLSTAQKSLQESHEIRSSEKTTEATIEPKKELQETRSIAQRSLKPPTKETTIASPSRSTTVKKWKPRKTSLETALETEGGSPKETSEDSKYALIEKELKLDESVSRIQNKLNSGIGSHELLSSIKQSIQSEKDMKEVNSTNNEDDSQAPILTYEEVDASTDTPNFERLLAKLDKENTDEISLFTTDFPDVPEDENASKTRTKKKDRKPVTG